MSSEIEFLEQQLMYAGSGAAGQIRDRLRRLYREQESEIDFKEVEVSVKSEDQLREEKAQRKDALAKALEEKGL